MRRTSDRTSCASAVADALAANSRLLWPEHARRLYEHLLELYGEDDVLPILASAWIAGFRIFEEYGTHPMAVTFLLANTFRFHLETVPAWQRVKGGALGAMTAHRKAVLGRDGRGSLSAPFLHSTGGVALAAAETHVLKFPSPIPGLREGMSNQARSFALRALITLLLIIHQCILSGTARSLCGERAFPATWIRKSA
uniref:Uncharacterized protein n=1 Tax=Streptomyces sp. NBC_01401 TaxID=2903854 RepID=A0AAU3H9W6_9ACTN